jgi:hypothetical protein
MEARSRQHVAARRRASLWYAEWKLLSARLTGRAFLEGRRGLSTLADRGTSLDTVDGPEEVAATTQQSTNESAGCHVDVIPE